MKKKIVFIIIIVIVGMIGGYYLEGERKEYYSLNDLKELLKETDSMVICPYSYENPYEVCTGDDILKTITDKNIINEIVSLIIPLPKTENGLQMLGFGTVIHTFDKDGNFLVNVFYTPYIGLEKGTSFYVLKNQNDLSTIIYNVE